MRLLTALGHVGLLASFSLAAGCGDSTGPGAPLAGTYHATTLRFEGVGEVIDLLAGGATITLELKDDESTTGTMRIPAVLTEDGTDFEASLAGTFHYDAQAQTVVFTQSGDTFIRDATWTVDGPQLRTEWPGGGSPGLTAVLTRD